MRNDAPEPSRLARFLLISPVLLFDDVVSHQAPQASGVLRLQLAPLLKESSIPGVHLLPGLGHLHTKYVRTVPRTEQTISPL